MARSRPDRLLVLCIALGGAACATVAPSGDAAAFDIAVLELSADLALAVHPGAADDELAREAAVEVRLRPKDPVELELLAQPVAGGAPNQGALLEVSLRWTDYVGTEPTSFGRSIKTFRPFGDDQRFSRTEPLSRVFRFELGEPEERVLARRLTVSGRLHPVDVLAPDAELRTGGARIELPTREAASLRRAPAEDFEACLAHAAEVEPTELFLAAVHGADADPEARVGRLVAALPEVHGARREALFGALHFLTGTTQGRSIARWEAWWAVREPGAADVPR